MKVLVDNYKKNDYVEMNNKYIEPYPRKMTCECCDSKLEYEKSDIKIGVFGCAYITCPLCDSNNFLDDGENELTLTRNNVEFPTHFWHTSMENGAVDVCNNTEVRDAIYKGISYFRENKNAESWDTAHGNLNVHVRRFSGDENYEITVTKDYYSTCIPFEKADY
jgi:Zn finger protein HypA/HybF involved in hydrogenase expression